MEILEVALPARQRVNADELFRKLGLAPADNREITRGWRQANARWRQERLERISQHAQRVRAELENYTARRSVALASGNPTKGRPRAVWCVELKRPFRTLSEAAHFVGRSPSNILQAVNRGVRCGPYHWDQFDPTRHAPENASVS